jgi:hypothetical protein
MKYRNTSETIDWMLYSVRSDSTDARIDQPRIAYSQLKECMKLLEDRQMIEFEPASQVVLTHREGNEVHECV